MARPLMLRCSLFLLLLPLSALGQSYYGGFYGRGSDEDLRGDYCRNLRCCPYRDDACSVPILGTRCYCDVFCDRGGEGADCCPDFHAVCRGGGEVAAALRPPEQIVKLNPENVKEGGPPFFINRPLPMQAVVPLKAPPGTQVFKLLTKHHDTRYFLVRDESGGRFEVDEWSGVVRTVGGEPFVPDKEYVLFVKAVDLSGGGATGEERLSIVGGHRPPQFYREEYETTIPHNQRRDEDIIEVRAKSFSDRPIRYTLLTQGRGAGTFTIGPTTGVVRLVKDLDDEWYALTVIATEEPGGSRSSVELIIKVSDVEGGDVPKVEWPGHKPPEVDEADAVGTLQRCLYEGKYYNPGHTISINCNKCTCRQKAGLAAALDFDCEQNVCLVRPDLIASINDGRHLWQATNYTSFWGETLHDGLKRRLGTFKPTGPTMEMSEIHHPVKGPLPQDFDSREKWRSLITPVRDQGDCAASWAFSTTALSSDRLAIESLGMERIELSPQHLLSCQRRGQRACHGGHLDKAWYFLRKNGATTGDCFPYSGEEEAPCPFENGASSGKVRCPTGGEGKLYFMTPPYRVGPKEEEIMRELYFNGPVQATFRVQPDFFVYRSGVYVHDDSLTDHLPQPFRQQDWHSVRILGWGQEIINGKKIKFWTCANSWGEEWGEDGYFRILRGQDECDIEMFIVGVWARTEPNQ